MPLSFLYRGHAEICSQMAATAKDAEIREQWTELAEQWRQKAEADEHQEPLSMAAPQAPTLVPEAALQEEPVAATSNPGRLDDIWAKVAEPISLEN